MAIKKIPCFHLQAKKSWSRSPKIVRFFQKYICSLLFGRYHVCVKLVRIFFPELRSLLTVQCLFSATTSLHWRVNEDCRVWDLVNLWEFLNFQLMAFWAFVLCRQIHYSKENFFLRQLLPPTSYKLDKTSSTLLNMVPFHRYGLSLTSSNGHLVSEKPTSVLTFLGF